MENQWNDGRLQETTSFYGEAIFDCVDTLLPLPSKKPKHGKKKKLGNATCSDVVGRLEAAGGREEGRKVALGAQRGHAHALRLQVLERLLDVQDRLDLIHIEQNKKPSPSLTSPSPSPTHSTAHHRSH